jgi:hypothetical protein
MKNKLTVLLAVSLVLSITLGCSLGGLIGSSETKESSSSGDRKDTSSGSEKKKEATPSGEVVKVGIQECDELATFINDNSEEIEGSIVLRGILYAYKNYVLESLKEGIEKMSDEEKAKAARSCKKALEQLKENMKK